ncbi:PH domain-containing protein [Serinicoccus chungangensis]|uniref:PH domain-containing protein n=1 Tax=Serinicoccus chungangensis TaxID=767452 RepID=UPI00137ACE28|nr:PH domain-containing protein [Serinicoccus chungangensis]
MSFPQTWGDAVWPVGTGFVTVLYAAMAIAAARARVEADPHELRICRGLRTQHLPWRSVTGLRNNAEGPWATHMVADLSDGSSADVPLPPDHQELVDFWDTLRSA